MSPLTKLTELLTTLPGIGPRHAKRLAYYISSRKNSFFTDIEKALNEINEQRKTCLDCRSIFYTTNKETKKCSLCLNKNRNNEQLIVTDTEINVENIERSGVTNGRYFILGKTLSLTDEDTNNLPIAELTNYIKRLSQKGLKEIVLVFNYNPEGEHTENLIKKRIKDICTKNKIKISLPGRGFSTGTELEYSDSDTLKHAFKNRVTK
jgi:recombination protein RecR